MGNSCLPGCQWWYLFVLSFFPLDVLDEIWDVVESVSERFLTYSKLVQAPGKFIAGRPKAALLFWFFGGFRCGVPLFIVMLVIY